MQGVAFCFRFFFIMGENHEKNGKMFLGMVALSLSLFALSCNKETEKDTKAPDEVGTFSVRQLEDDKALLTWTNPGDGDFAGTKLSMSPAIGELAEEKSLKSDVSTFTVTGLTGGQSYTFTIKTFDKSGNVSEGLAVRDQIKDIVAPGEVSDFKVEAENGQAVLTWANPTDSDFAGTKLSMKPAIGQLAQEKVWQAMLPHLQ